MREFILIPVEWARGGLGVIAACAVGIGVFSLAWPQRSILFYQWLMASFHWRAEPMFPEREVRNTRILGTIMTALSVLIFIFLSRI